MKKDYDPKFDGDSKHFERYWPGEGELCQYDQDPECNLDGKKAELCARRNKVNCSHYPTD